MLHVRNLTLGAWSVDASEDYSLGFRNITDIVRARSSGTVFASRTVEAFFRQRQTGREAGTQSQRSGPQEDLRARLPKRGRVPPRESRPSSKEGHVMSASPLQTMHV